MMLRFYFEVNIVYGFFSLRKLLKNHSLLNEKYLVRINETKGEYFEKRKKKRSLFVNERFEMK